MDRRNHDRDQTKHQLGALNDRLGTLSAQLKHVKNGTLKELHGRTIKTKRDRQNAIRAIERELESVNQELKDLRTAPAATRRPKSRPIPGRRRIDLVNMDGFLGLPPDDQYAVSA